MNVLVKLLASVGAFRKGEIHEVDANHWLARSGYAKVVGEVEPVATGIVGGDLRSPSDRRVARRRPKKVSDVPDSAQSDERSDSGAAGGSQSGQPSGESVASSDEEDGS